MKDYFFSNFYNSNDPRLLSNFYDTKYYEIISKENGDNLLIKTYNTLCKYGVSSEDIDAVMEIMIDRY